MVGARGDPHTGACAVKRIYAAAKYLDATFRLNANDPKGVYIEFDDPRDTYLERICHELAHGALLGLPPGPLLGYRVDLAAEALKKKPGRAARRASDDNEIETYAVVMEVFRRFGVRVDRAIMLAKCKRMASSEAHVVLSAWRAFRTDLRREAAVQSVLAVLYEHIPSVGTKRRRGRSATRRE